VEATATQRGVGSGRSVRPARTWKDAAGAACVSHREGLRTPSESSRTALVKAAQGKTNVRAQDQHNTAYG